MSGVSANFKNDVRLTGDASMDISGMIDVSGIINIGNNINIGGDLIIVGEISGNGSNLTNIKINEIDISGYSQSSNQSRVLFTENAEGSQVFHSSETLMYTASTETLEVNTVNLHITDSSYALDSSGGTLEISGNLDLSANKIKYFWISSSDDASFTIQDFEIISNGSNLLLDSDTQSFLTPSMEYLDNITSTTTSTSFTTTDSKPNLLIKISNSIDYASLSSITRLDYIWNQNGDDILRESGGDTFGNILSINNDGNIIACGAQTNDGGGDNAGHARVFEYTNGSWTQLGSDIDGSSASENLGKSISLNYDGTVVAIGGGNFARVYQYTSSTWVQMGDDISGESGDNFGTAISINGDGTIVVISGAGNSGVARVYQYSNSSWNQLGDDINGPSYNSDFGYAKHTLSINNAGDIFAVGARKHATNGIGNSGLVRVYQYTNSSWSQLGGDNMAGTSGNDFFGQLLDLNYDGTVVALNDRVYRYSTTDASWVQVGSDFGNPGDAVSINNDGTIVAHGNRFYDGTYTDEGHAQIFQYINDEWIEIGNITGGGSGQKTGNGVALNGSGNIVSFGSTRSNGFIRVYESETITNTLNVKLINDENKNISEFQIGDTIPSLNQDILGNKGVGIDFEIQDDVNGNWNNSYIYSTSNSLNAGDTTGGLAFFTENGSENYTWADENKKLAMLMSGVSGESPSVYVPGNIGIGTIPNNQYPVSVLGDIDQSLYLNFVKYVLISSENDISFSISNFKLYENETNVVNNSNYVSYLTSSSDFINSRTSISSLSSDGFTYQTTDSYPNVLLEVNDYILYSHITKITTNVDISNSLQQYGNTVNGVEALGYFGSSVAINDDGTIIAVGAPKYDANGTTNAGEVRVYQYDSVDESWNQLGPFINQGTNVLSGQFGLTVAMNGDGTVVGIGLPKYNTRKGLVKIYSYDSSNNSWDQIGENIISPHDKHSHFGIRMSLNQSGTIVAISAPWESITNSSEQGYVHVYEYDSTNDTWDQLGNTIEGIDICSNLQDHFGEGLELSPDGTILAIGAADVFDPANTIDGYVRVYKYDSVDNSWNLLGSQLTGSNSEGFGSSVSMNNNGTRLVVGSSAYDTSSYTHAGAIRVYEYDETDQSWNQIGQDIYGESTDNLLGHSVSMHGSGSFIVVGGYGYNSEQGVVRVYSYNDVSNAWNQVDTDILGNTSSYFGYDVAISKNSGKILVGSPYGTPHEDTNTSIAGLAEVYYFQDFFYEVQLLNENYNTLETILIRESGIYNSLTSPTRFGNAIKFHVGTASNSLLSSSIQTTTGLIDTSFNYGELAFFTNNGSNDESLDISNENLAMIMAGISGENPRIYIPGNVGIGITEPVNPLEVLGTCLATTNSTTSDIRAKENIKPLKNALDIIMKLEGKSFTFKNDSSRRKKYGVIAQQIENVIPGIVSNPHDKSKYKSVNYNGIIPFLVESVKEQQKMIEERYNLLSEQSIVIENIKKKFKI